MEKSNELEIKYKIIGFAVTAIIIIGGLFLIFGGQKDAEEKSSNTTGKPSNIELMSYAQTVLDDKLYKPQYSRDLSDYEIIETGLRYKIEGTVNNEKFHLIIEFVDDKYKEYDVISLQVGSQKY